MVYNQLNNRLIMRKKITTATCGAILIAAVAFGIHNNMQKSSALSELALQNIEALVDGEDDTKVSGCVPYEGVCIIEFQGNVIFAEGNFIPVAY